MKATRVPLRRDHWAGSIPEERLGGFVGQEVEDTIEALSRVANALVQIREEISFVLA